MIDQLLDRFDDPLMRHLAAQMEKMLRPQPAFALGRGDRRNRRMQHLGPYAILTHLPDGQCVEHRGDARPGDLRIVCQHGRGHRPTHGRAGRDVLFEVVGMQFDEARQ